MLLLYCSAGELREVDRLRRDGFGEKGKRMRPNAMKLHISAGNMMEDPRRPDVKWVAAGELMRNFPFTASEPLRLFVRQKVPNSNRWMWLLLQDSMEQIEVEDDIVNAQLVGKAEHPFLDIVKEDRWWEEQENLAQPQEKRNETSKSETTFASAAAARATAAVNSLSSSFSSKAVQDKLQKTSTEVSSNLNTFASWAKKGISEAMQTSETISMPSRTIKMKKKIADGGFSEVFLVSDAGSGQSFAMKRCLAQTQEEVNSLRREVLVHQKTNHDHVLKLVDVLEEQSRRVATAKEIYLLFPLYTGGSLVDQMESAKSNAGSPWPFPERVAASLIHDVLGGLQALHDAGYAHRDIKPHNILLQPKGGAMVNLPDGFQHVQPVLMDLGSCAPLRVKVSTRSEALMAVDEASVKCSAPYRAPELFEVPSLPYEFDGSIDVWSIGTTLYAMTFGRLWSPFEHPIHGLQTLAILQAKVTFPSTSAFSKDLAKILKSTMQLQASKRPSVKQLQNHLSELIT